MGGNGAGRVREHEREADRGMKYAEVSESGGDGPSGRPAEVTPRGQTCATYSGIVAAGDQAL